MGSRHIEQVDMDTGEVLQGCMVYLPYRPKHTERFFMAFQDGLMKIAEDDELTGADFRVLLHLFGQLDFENYLHISQKDIAEALGVQKQHISRSMRLLIAKGIVVDGPKVGRIKTYRLSSNLGWKGRVTNLEKQRRNHLHVIQGGKGKEVTENPVSVNPTEPA